VLVDVVHGGNHCTILGVPQEKKSVASLKICTKKSVGSEVYIIRATTHLENITKFCRNGPIFLGKLILPDSP
jgi:hypothetical protein